MHEALLPHGIHRGAARKRRTWPAVIDRRSSVVSTCTHSRKHRRPPLLSSRTGDDKQLAAKTHTRRVRQNEHILWFQRAKDSLLHTTTSARTKTHLAKAGLAERAAKERCTRRVFPGWRLEGRRTGWDNECPTHKPLEAVSVPLSSLDRSDGSNWILFLYRCKCWLLSRTGEQILPRKETAKSVKTWRRNGVSENAPTAAVDLQYYMLF